MEINFKMVTKRYPVAEYLKTHFTFSVAVVFASKVVFFVHWAVFLLF